MYAAEPNAEWEDAETRNGKTFPSLRLSYAKGSEAACSRKNQSPRMTIKFTCCDTLGTPKIHDPKYFPDAECRFDSDFRNILHMHFKYRSYGD